MSGTADLKVCCKPLVLFHFAGCNQKEGSGAFVWFRISKVHGVSMQCRTPEIADHRFRVLCRTRSRRWADQIRLYHAAICKKKGSAQLVFKAAGGLRVFQYFHTKTLLEIISLIGIEMVKSPISDKGRPYCKSQAVAAAGAKAFLLPADKLHRASCIRWAVGCPEVEKDHVVFCSLQLWQLAWQMNRPCDESLVQVSSGIRRTLHLLLHSTLGAAPNVEVDWTIQVRVRSLELPV